MQAEHLRWAGPAVAAGGAVLGAAVGLALPQPFQIFSSAVLGATMAAIALEDLRSLKVPDPLNLVAALAGFVTVSLEALSAGLDPLPAIGHAAAQALLCGGALFLVREAFFRLRHVDGLGLGDVKLAATAGIWLGWEVFALALALAAVSALAFVAVRVARAGSWPRGKRIPFAFFLAPAIWTCWYLSRLFQLS